MKYSMHAVREAARVAGTSEEAVAKLLNHLRKASHPSPDHRVRYPRKQQQCSFPIELSVDPLIDAPLFCDFFVPLDRMRERELLAFWSDAEPTHLAHFHGAAAKVDFFQKVLLEVLISAKERRQPIPGFSPQEQTDTIQLREVVARVAERGARNHGWCGGNVPLCVGYYLKTPGKILAALSTIHRRFRCVVVVCPEMWGSLESEVTLTQVPTIRSIAYEQQLPN